jgi:hypothetical protein
MGIDFRVIDTFYVPRAYVVVYDCWFGSVVAERFLAFRGHRRSLFSRVRGQDRKK